MAPDLKCSNPGCRIAETGKCIEGLTLERCPNFGRAGASPPPMGSPDTEAEERATGIALSSGERFNVGEASAILRASVARVVAIIGPSDAGKTSLIASLYDLFQRGPVDVFRFARSRTLYAFEQACHHARAVSQRAKPHTERTPLGDVGFYHLGLRSAEADAYLDLLLADRAGEEYRLAADDPSSAAGFSEVYRADTVTVLVDGHRLLDIGARHNLRSGIQMMLQALVDGGVISRRQQLAIALTKLDEIANSAEKDRAESDFQSFVQRVRQLFGPSFGVVESFQLAASPVNQAYPRGFGLPELLHFWTTTSVASAQPTVALPKSSRAIGRLMAPCHEGL